MMRKHLTAALIFFALTLLLTNPLALHIWNSVEDKQDALLNTWIVAWVGHALVTDPLNLYNTNIFYPYTNTLAFSEILLTPSLFALPITLATNNPIFGYNFALFAMLWLNAFAMYLFALYMTRRAEAGWIAGAIYAFNPFNLGNFAQLQLVTLGFLPLALLCLGKLLRVGGRERAALGTERGDVYIAGEHSLPILFALFFVLQALASFYYALLAGFAVAVYLAWWVILQRAALYNSVRRVFVPLAASFVLIGLVLIPFLLPYFQVQRELGFSRRVEESEPFSASLKQFTEVRAENVLYGKLLAPHPIVRVGGYPLDNLFPGLIAILFALLGLIFSRAQSKFFLLSLLIFSFLLALGPRLYLSSQHATDIILPYHWLYEIFSPLRALRAPVRFDALINFALAALAGLGAAFFIARLESSRQGRILQNPQVAQRIIKSGAFLLVGLIALEYLAVPAANIVTLPVANEIPEVYKWLAQQPHGVVLELPMMGPNEKNELDISTQYFSTYHWQNTPDGYSGFVPPRRGEIAYEMENFPSVRASRLLQILNAQFVITRQTECSEWRGGGTRGDFQPIKPMPSLSGRCVYAVLPAESRDPDLEKSLYVPSNVAAGARFNAYLILRNWSKIPHAVKPTDRAQVEFQWSDGRIEQVSFPIPLVTSSVSVAPISMTAPSRAGKYELRAQANDPTIGATNVGAFVNVGNELAREVVLPASVELSRPLQKEYARGETIVINLTWLPLNKINAYFSASVRLVNAQGEKVLNVDRQPRAPTFLWKPDIREADEFILEIPRDIPVGNYRVEVLMYQADTDEGALLLDENFVPRESIVLGEIVVK